MDQTKIYADTRIITELREAINRAENMVPFMRQDMIQLLEGAKCEIEALAANLKQMQNERDEAIRERDKARREACERTAENLSLLGSSVRLSTLRVEHAARRGWHCFKDETQ